MRHQNAPSVTAWLFVTPVLTVVLFAVVVYLTVHNFRQQEATLSSFQTEAARRLENISDLSRQISQAHVELFEALGGAGEELDEGQLYDRTKDTLNALHALETRLTERRADLIGPESDTRNFNRLVAEFQEYRAQAISSVLMTTVELDNAQIYMSRANTRYKTVNHLLAEILATTLSGAKATMQQVNAGSRQLTHELVILLILAAAGSLVVSLLISRSLSREFRGIISALTALASGRTSIELPARQRSDEIGEMARATEVFRQTLAQLHDEMEQREKTADALRAERNFVAAINDTIGALVVVLDRDGHIIRFNRACEQATNYSFAEVGGKVVWEVLVDDADGDAWRTLVARPAAIEGQSLLESQWRTRDGGMRLISWAFTTIRDATGEIEYVIACGVDSTERKEAEDKLRQAQKMEAIGQLTGGIAHDFNNLLAVIMGNLELLDEKLADSPGRDHEPVKMALRATERGAALTQRLLAFARKQPLQPRLIDLNRLIADMEPLLSRTLAGRVSVILRPASDLWLCEADAAQLENVLLNLSINARDAMPDGGELFVATGNERVLEDADAEDGMGPGEYVRLAVTDTGTGMCAATREKAFDPFFTTKEPGQGSGLGLSMVYGFVKQSQGHVAIASEPGHGTTVTVYLPRAAADAIQSSSQSEPFNYLSPRNETVLVVEDEPDVLALTVTMLRSLGYQPIEAATAKAALDTLERSPEVDLLLTDVVLAGGMSGEQLASTATRLRPGLKVLFISGYTKAFGADPGRLESGVNFLQKPFRKAELAYKIRSALESQNSDANTLR